MLLIFPADSVMETMVIFMSNAILLLFSKETTGHNRLVWQIRGSRGGLFEHKESPTLKILDAL